MRAKSLVPWFVMSDWDLVCVGGGLAGSALAIAMAKKGARVLVVEPETAFKDRVRGEAMMPWGVTEARALGIEDAILSASGRALSAWKFHFGPQVRQVDLAGTPPHRAPILAFFHPQMQEAVLAEAARAGAEVWRGATVRGVKSGSPPGVIVDRAGKQAEITARLVVGADGRGSNVRKWAGFAATQDPPRLLIAGVLLEGMSMPTDAAVDFQSFGKTALFFPQGNDRVRAYYCWNKDVRATRIQGANNLPHLVDACVEIGVPSEWLKSARAVGPLATFDGADCWVKHPHRDGVVLVGDAAASSDPTFGQGLSLTLRDVRVLRDALLATDDWLAAADAYAREHDRYYGNLHTYESWFTQLFMEIGDEADARRGRVLPRLAMDPTILPPTLFVGPDAVHDEAMRARLFDG